MPGSQAAIDDKSEQNISEKKSRLSIHRKEDSRTFIFLESEMARAGCLRNITEIRILSPRLILRSGYTFAYCVDDLSTREAHFNTHLSREYIFKTSCTWAVFNSRPVRTTKSMFVRSNLNFLFTKTISIE